MSDVQLSLYNCYYVSLSIVIAEAKKCHRIETPLIELNLPEPRTADVYLFADDTFVCAGRIVKYDLYAVKLGTVYVGAWMQVNTGGEFRFIGANKLTITKLGQQVIHLMEFHIGMNLFQCLNILVTRT